ncbi:hypothetical protein BDK51DRAFT_26479 [Blyttiomyces helicus]|uniref:Uncharacterized protein n=1 Tax=Blyttiomyces helicus TaxID=388810 RepID=A0A4V1IR53_9FUNG|nr:hypothetical protein BDK51DRAFT_26479 [Blyttiomyces helicus]|eukprot:RKO88857.1 hypothetical protein BDK51DRAFT_26479 [Blyttiomyces helicus]
MPNNQHDLSVSVTVGSKVVAVNQLWGFNPLELLESVKFPSDKQETLIRRSKSARMMAIRGISIVVDDSDAEAPASPAESAASSPPASAAPTRRRRASAVYNGWGAIPIEDEAVLLDQLSRSAAALLIQSAFRGWRTRRRYVAVVYGAMSEKLLRKYKKYCARLEKYSLVPPDFPFFAATYIANYWRMSRRHESAENELRDARNDVIWRARMANSHYAVLEKAARKIQTAWKNSYASRVPPLYYIYTRIYRFYRDLIKFRERGDPRQLLRFINPQEARLIDASMGLHVRFRLGGASFPPTIFYKIFVHQNMVDMNAFSPRAYTLADTKAVLPKTLFNNVGELPGPVENGGWYQRFDNNGWRPVSDKGYDQVDEANEDGAVAQLLGL